MSLRLRRWLLALSVLGVGISGYLSWVKLTDTEAVCGGLGDCSTVQNSIYAYLLGIPVAYLGLLVYLAILAVGIYNLVVEVERREWSELGFFVLVFGGFAFSAYLTYTELFLLHAICPWCVVSFVNLTVMTILAAKAVFSEAEDEEI